MYIDEQECTGCGECIPYCPVEAISDQGGVSVIDFDNCVECGVCYRFVDCPADAIHHSPETAEWPRIMRQRFSDPIVIHPGTGMRGRGTEEMKTNDVTGRVKRGEIGIGMEFGRPGVATRLAELEKMTMALAAIGVNFEHENPVTELLANPETGEMKPELRNERVLSAIVEIQTTPDKLSQILPFVQEVASRVDTTITWEMITRLNEDGSIPILEDLRKFGITPRANGKINLGMGRPRAAD
jgi:NAD-dependent dihydropyrimidine dehydrogenase PreA subunit